MKSAFLMMTLLTFLSTTAHADCNARKVARHAAMQATVGVSAHCGKNTAKEAVKNSDVHVKKGTHR
ncbi:hypothetical protein GJV06_01935 [Enterobacteriaceae bacterium RIT691]|nr:hypothetical protein [Enterobacteriaceae bacterium RIT691]